MRQCTAILMLCAGFMAGCSGPSPQEATSPPEGAAAASVQTDPVAETVEPDVAPASDAATQVATAPVTTPDVVEADATLSVDAFIGDYADDAYAQRGEGYDWVGVRIEKIHDRAAYIRVRARGDKKRPTCTFDGVGLPTADNVLEVDVEGKPLIFSLVDDTVTASIRSQDDEYLLYYPCSGGASLAGPYKRLSEPLDDSQLAPEAFSSVLSLQNVTFSISANDVMPVATLVIRPEGLEVDNRLIVQPIEGSVTGAEIEDLNSDGWPEVVVYVTSAGSGSYGTVVGYSVNAGKSVSAISFPELTGDAAQGYMGHDEFTVIETSLARRFPIYREGDSNAEPTGGIRQIQYKLVEGEAARAFEIVNVTDLNVP